MILYEVRQTQDDLEFLQVHVAINKDLPGWIRPLDKDILQVFDPAKNKYFRHGEVKRWILKQPDGKLIGRIAAFTNKRYKNKGDTFPVGGFGFFDCINDQQSANLLFDTAKEWLQQKGMKAMDGPINFGERDKWWGLLLKGFIPPLYNMNYNPPYYQQLFETYGFQIFYNQICWSMPIAGDKPQLQEKFYKAHAMYSKHKGFEVRQLRKKDLAVFVKDFCKIYNKAWASHQGNKDMRYDQALREFRAMKPVLDENLSWFTYYNGEPIAMWVSIPDLNQIFRHFNGRFNWFDKLKFLYYQYTGICDRFVGIIYGVVPEFQGSGVDYYMIVEAEKVIKNKTRYKEVELQWQGDFNPKMLNISKHLDGKESRLLATYRYLFDRTKPFHRHPILN